MSTAPEPRETPKRLRAVDVIDQQQETIKRLTERHTSAAPTASVDFTRNAKGETQIGVKVTANMDHDRDELAPFLEHVFAQSLAVYEKATRRYPTATGTVTNDPPPKP